VRKLQDASFGVRQLANLRLGTAKAFATPGPRDKDRLTETRGEAKKERIPWQKKLIVICIVCGVLLWYAHTVKRHMAAGSE
jgi:hypothetical protein